MSSLPRSAPKVQTIQPQFTWTGCAYRRVPPGTYSAIGKRVQGPEWCSRFGRWGLRVEFELLSGDGQVSVFYNFGRDPAEARVGGQHSKYFADWSRANGEPPRNGQKMRPDVFLDGQVFEIAVGDSSGKGPTYSRVTEILSAAQSRAKAAG